MRIISDIHGLERVAGPGTEVLTFCDRDYRGRWGRNCRLLKASPRADYLIIRFSLNEIVFFGVLATARCERSTRKPDIAPQLAWAARMRYALQSCAP